MISCGSSIKSQQREICSDLGNNKSSEAAPLESGMKLKNKIDTACNCFIIVAGLLNFPNVLKLSLGRVVSNWRFGSVHRLASNMSRLWFSSHRDLDSWFCPSQTAADSEKRRDTAWEWCTMHLWEQQLYNYIISHLNKLPGFCCHCVYIHSDYYPGEAPFKQWGGPKKKKWWQEWREKKLSQTFLERIRIRTNGISDGIFKAHFVLSCSQRWMSTTRACTQTPTTNK